MIIGDWLAERSLGKPPAVDEVELCEHMVCIEEELGHQRERIKTILEQMDMRFEAMDQRFGAMQKSIYQCFEALTPAASTAS